MSTAASFMRVAQRTPLSLEQCVFHLPFGTPTIKETHVFIGREGYVLAHDPIAKIPNWVSYRLTPAHSVGLIKRSDAFSTDQSLPANNRSEPGDYAKSNFDKGHMACDADMKWNTLVERESFLMSNMAPQHGDLNRFVWEHLEVAVRAWTIKSQQDHLIYVGPIYDSSCNTIGGNKVVVPNGFYKIIINLITNECAAFEFPHLPPYQYPSDFRPFLSDVSAIEGKTGISFPMPANVSTLSQNNLWVEDVSVISEATKKLKS